MTDKVEKIRAYIEKLHREHRGSKGDSIFRRALRTVLFYIDSMQEEPKECMYSKDNYTDEDRQVLCDGCEEECKYNKKETVSDGCIYNRTLEERQYSCKYCSAACQARIEELSIADIVDEHFDEMLGEEPVSDDLEKVVEEIVDPTVLNAYGVKEIANRLRRTMIDSVSDDLDEAGKEWLKPQLDKSYANYGEAKMMELTHFDGYAMLDAIEFGTNWQKQKDSIPVSEDLGEYINELSKQFPEVSFAKLSRIAVRVAKWQKEQFEKNRLKHCDSITNEQAELEQKFLDQHLDKYNCMPTFLDAIEYGMRLKGKEMQSTIELAEDHAMLAGMEKMKEQLIASGTDVTVHIEAGNYPYIPQIELYDYDKDIPLAKEGDKYKVILIKED